MTSINLQILLALTLFAVYVAIASGFLIPDSLKSESNLAPLLRQKRQLEDFDNDMDQFAAASNQDSEEEPGFWDRVVKVALKLFNRFIEWLNSS